MTQFAMIDPNTIGQMVVEGLTILHDQSDGDGFDLPTLLRREAEAGAPLQPLQELMPIARDIMDDASILSDPQKQLRVAVAHDAMSGLLSVYGVDA